MTEDSHAQNLAAMLRSAADDETLPDDLRERCRKRVEDDQPVQTDGPGGDSK